jgi:exonuclease VII small subunit
MMTPLRDRRLLVVFLAALLTLAAAPKPTPTPTPAAPPRLTGGFGKTAAGVASRKSTEKKKVRITNESLVTEPDKGKLTTSDIRPAPTPSPKVGEPRPGGTPSPPTTAAPAAATEGGEEYWRGEVRRLRERVTELKETIARLETETTKLESDFYSWDDGAYRDRVIKPAWDKAREQLATARKELPVAEKDLADLPDRARKEGALPGWLRE